MAATIESRLAELEERAAKYEKRNVELESELLKQKTSHEEMIRIVSLFSNKLQELRIGLQILKDDFEKIDSQEDFEESVKKIHDRIAAI